MQEFSTRSLKYQLKLAANTESRQEISTAYRWRSKPAVEGRFASDERLGDLDRGDS
jgi:hypothetical protein